MLTNLTRAIARRQTLLGDSSFASFKSFSSLPADATTAFRLADSRGDSLDGVEIDTFAGRWLVQTRAPAFPDWLRATGHPIAIYWKQLGEHKDPPIWIEGEQTPDPFEIMENGMRFWIDFTSGYSQGIFLDQRNNRAETRRRTKGLRVLNCFAYTCAFGVAAALGGAQTVNVDLSKRYLDWGRRNYDLNGIPAAGHEFIAREALSVLDQFARKGRRFDLVILDPPTFSRDKAGKVFTVAKSFAELVRAAEEVLTDKGFLFCSTNQRTLTPEAFRRLIADGLSCPGIWRMDTRRMPPDFTGEQYLKAVWVQRR